MDKIVGLVNVYDVLYDTERKSTIRPYIRKAWLIPDTKSIDGGNLCRFKRKASRKRRFQRLRSTASPTFRETDRPSRGHRRSFRQP